MEATETVEIAGAAEIEEIAEIAGIVEVAVERSMPSQRDSTAVPHNSSFGILDNAFATVPAKSAPYRYPRSQKTQNGIVAKKRSSSRPSRWEK